MHICIVAYKQLWKDKHQSFTVLSLGSKIGVIFFILYFLNFLPQTDMHQSMIRQNKDFFKIYVVKK